MTANMNSTIRRSARILIAALLTACGGGGSGGYVTTAPPPPPDPKTIDATAALAFTPASLAVHVGDQVSFAFGGVGHNVFFDPQAGAPADIGGTNANVTLTRTFTTAGTYRYTCHIHPAMHGEVVVQ